MYAIIAAGGRQYKVVEGQELQIDYRQDVAPGDSLSFDRVVAYSDGSSLKLGEPDIGGAKVTAQVLGVEAGPEAGDPKVSPPQNLPPPHGPSPDVHPGEDRKVSPSANHRLGQSPRSRVVLLYRCALATTPLSPSDFDELSRVAAPRRGTTQRGAIPITCRQKPARSSAAS